MKKRKSKNELKALTQALIKEIERIEDHCERSPLFTTVIDINALILIKKSLIIKYLPLLEEDAASDADVVTSATKLKQLNSSLDAFELDVLKASKTLTHLLAPESTESFKLAASACEKLTIQITEELANISEFPKHYLQDKSIKTWMDQLERIRSTWPGLQEILAKDLTNSSKAMAYNRALKTLTSLLTQISETYNQVKLRHQALAPLEKKYEEAIFYKHRCLEKAQEFLLMTPESIDALATYNREAASKAHLIKTLTLKFTRMFDDTAAVFLGKLDEVGEPRSFIDLERAAAVCMESSSTVLREIDAFNQLSGREIIARLEASIVDQKSHFNYFFSIINDMLTQEHPAKRPAEEIQARFYQAYFKKKPADQDSFIFLHKKLGSLREELDRIKDQVKTYSDDIKDKLTLKIQQLETELATRGKGILTRMAAFTLSEEKGEQEAPKKIAELYLPTPESIELTAPTLDSLRVKYQTLLQKSLDMDAPFAELKHTLDIHQLAKDILKLDSDSMIKLAVKLNTDNEGARVLSVFEHYWTCEEADRFFRKLASHLDLFESSALTQIAAFIEPRGDAGIIGSIKRKLKFITLVSEKMIYYSTFIEKDHVVEAALLLDELKLNRYITFSNLSNDDFCMALIALKKYPLDLTIDDTTIRTLLRDANKCRVICKQATLYSCDFSGLKPSQSVFNAFIQDFLMVEDRVAKAAHTLCSQAPELYCAPWALILIKENALLRDSLNRDDLFGDIWPFLLPVFEHLEEYREGLRSDIANYFVDDVEIREQVKTQLANKIADHEKTLNAIVSYIAQSQDRCDLIKLATVMKKFNTFYTDYPRGSNLSQQDMLALRRFRLGAIPILLSHNNMHIKKRLLENLAKDHFKDKYENLRILADVLQIISLAFIIIMPIRYALHKTLFFTQTSIHARKTMDVFAEMDEGHHSTWFQRLLS
jgi:hypothetical protein